ARGARSARPPAAHSLKPRQTPRVGRCVGAATAPSVVVLLAARVACSNPAGSPTVPTNKGEPMKQLITVLAFAAAVFASSAYAADAASAPKSASAAKASAAKASAPQAAPMATAASAPTKQQTRMGTCSAEFKATGKPGSERQAF